MSIPADIATELLDVQAELVAASPLGAADFATIKALQLNAANLVADLQGALDEPSLLDTWVAPVDAVGIVAGVLTVVQAGDDQKDLSLMRGVVGRAASNLDQMV